MTRSDLYDLRHADLLFEVVTRRYGVRSTLITTNANPLPSGTRSFPTPPVSVTLIDRLVHHAEIVQIDDGDSYRLKEAKENAARKAKERAARRAASDPVTCTTSPTSAYVAEVLRTPVLPPARHTRPAAFSRPLPRRRTRSTKKLPLDLIRAAFVVATARRLFSTSAPLPRHPLTQLLSADP